MAIPTRETRSPAQANFLLRAGSKVYPVLSPHFSPGAVMIAEDFGPVYTRARARARDRKHSGLRLREHVRARPVCTRGQKTREGAASAVRYRHDHRHRGQTSETQELFDADKRPGEKCGLACTLGDPRRTTVRKLQWWRRGRSCPSWLVGPHSLSEGQRLHRDCSRHRFPRSIDRNGGSVRWTP